MGLGVKNINLGAQYHDYLKRQVEELGDTQHRIAQDKLDDVMRHKNYNLQGMTETEIRKQETQYSAQKLVLTQKKQQDNLNRFTRCSGELAKEYGLDGALSSEKLHTIANLEMGIDPRTAPFVKVIKQKVHTIKDESTAHILDKENGRNIYLTQSDLKKGIVVNELGKEIKFEKKDVQHYDIKLSKFDLENGYTKNINSEKIYFTNKNVKTVEIEQRKTATELTFSVDNTFSYRYQMMNDDQKKEFEKIFFESADKAFNDEIGNHFKNSKDENGKLIVYDVMHTDNRDGLPFIHIHKDVSNVMKMPDGSISATELDAIKQKGFHQKVDAIFKADFIERFQNSFPDIAIETYDKEKKSVVDFDKQRVKDYRIAFDQESLDKIKRNSTTPEKIEQVVKEQLKDERNRFDKAISDIEQSKKDGIIDQNKYYKTLSNAYQEHTNKDKYINSSKNKAIIQGNIKNKKTDESLDNKTQRLDDYVLSLGLKEKTESENIGIVHPEQILDHINDNVIIGKLTSTNATFTENELITEYVNHYGLAGMTEKFKKEPIKEQPNKEKANNEQDNKEEKSKKSELISIKDSMQSNTKIEQKIEIKKDIPDAIKAKRAEEHNNSQSQSGQQDRANTMNNDAEMKKSNAKVKVQELVLKRQHEYTR